MKFGSCTCGTPDEKLPHQHRTECPVYRELGRQLARLDPVVEKVRADLHRRSQLGIMKYGNTLGDNPAAHRDKLQHAYEEALDLANYLAWAIMELDRKGVTSLEDQRLAGLRLHE